MFRVLPLLLLLTLGSGCATEALWDKTGHWNASNGPADEPNLRATRTTITHPCAEDPRQMQAQVRGAELVPSRRR